MVDVGTARRGHYNIIVGPILLSQFSRDAATQCAPGSLPGWGRHSCLSRCIGSDFPVARLKFSSMLPESLEPPDWKVRSTGRQECLPYTAVRFSAGKPTFRFPSLSISSKLTGRSSPSQHGQTHRRSTRRFTAHTHRKLGSLNRCQAGFIFAALRQNTQGEILA